MKRLLTLCLSAFFSLAAAFAQTDVTVTVKDDMGPIIGANILVKGTTNGQMTDLDGVARFTSLKDTDVLVISFVGYRTTEVTVGTKAKINVFLETDSEDLDEIVVVGYGTQKKASLTSAISNIKSEDIVSTKQSDLIASLQGKVPGLQIRQLGGRPGGFGSDLSLRGFGSPLIIIDGVARTERVREATFGYSMTDSGAAALAQLNPEDIESISVLKDASAAIYGLGAQNGVILVTTKKGQIGKPSVRYSNTFSFATPTAFPESVDIITYMERENEMRINSRQAAKYSDETIQHYLNGDPGYVDTDWYAAVMKKAAFNMTHNLSIRGGSQQTQYYLSGNYTDDNSIFKGNPNNNKRLNFTGNVTAKITPEFSAMFQSSMMYSKTAGLPGNTNQCIFYYMALADRTIAPTVYGNDSHYSAIASSENRNPLALLDRETAGYSDNYTMSFRNNLEFKYEPVWLKGLTMSLNGAYDYSSYRTDELTLSFPLYDYRTDQHVIDNADKNKYSESWHNRQRLYIRYQANYNKRIGDHNLSATFAAEATKHISNSASLAREYGDFYTHDIINQGDESTQTNDGYRSESATAGYIGRLSYDYKGKYLVDLIGRYDGTYIYAPGYRWGFFPAYSVGWRVSEERWFKQALPWFNNLKFRWSDGRTGSSQGYAYAYQLGYTTDGSYIFDEGSTLSGYTSHSVAETLLSWTDVRTMDFGVDWEMWRGKFGGSIDWFWRNTSGIAATASTTVPDFYGLSLPQQNLNKSQNVGIDLQLSHQNNIGEFWYRVAGTVTFARYRTTYKESDKTAIYTSSADYYANHFTGRWSDARSAAMFHWADGSQFGSLSEINSHNVLYDSGKGMSDVLPGMYRIEDRNGDGVINSADYYYTWGESNPPLQFGLILSGRYKGFDFNFNFAGATLTHKAVSLSGAFGYGFFGTFYKNYEDHYTLADGYTDPFDPNSKWESGYFPAIVKATSAYDGAWGNGSNYPYRANQPYNYIDSSFLRLKSAEIGWTLPSAWTDRIKMKSVRLYVNGTNLLTFCNKLLKHYDPERNENSWLGAGGYPLMKTYSFGVNVNF